MNNVLSNTGIKIQIALLDLYKPKVCVKYLLQKEIGIKEPENGCYLCILAW